MDNGRIRLQFGSGVVFRQGHEIPTARLSSTDYCAGGGSYSLSERHGMFRRFWICHLIRPSDCVPDKGQNINHQEIAFFPTRKVQPAENHPETCCKAARLMACSCPIRIVSGRSPRSMAAICISRSAMTCAAKGPCAHAV